MLNLNKNPFEEDADSDLDNDLLDNYEEEDEGVDVESYDDVDLL